MGIIFFYLKVSSIILSLYIFVFFHTTDVLVRNAVHIYNWVDTLRGG